MKKNFRIKNNEKILKSGVVTYISLSLCFVFWELAVYLSDVSSIVIIKPSEIYPTLFENSAIFLVELGFTFKEVVVGWMIGNLAGLAVAIIIFGFKLVSKMIVGLAVMVNAVPLIALSAIISGFMGTGPASKIFIVAIVCFFPMLITALTSFAAIGRDFISLFDTFAAKPYTKFLLLILPSAMPQLMVSLKVSFIIAVSTAIVSEFFGAHGGIGQFILARKGFYDLPMVWGAIFYIILFSALGYFFLSVVQKKLFNW